VIKEDDKYRMFANIPVKMDNICTIYSYTLYEIMDIGYEKYHNYLMNLISEPKDFLKNIDIKDLEDLTTFDIITSNLYHTLIKDDDKYYNLIQEAFRLFIKEDIELFWDNNELKLIIDRSDRIIDKENYNTFKNILKTQNGFDKEKKEEFIPANDKANEIKQKILKARQKRKTKDDEITFHDLISVLAANSKSVNILNVWDLNIYQFNNQFTRMKMIEDYDIGIRSILAGAKSEDVKLKYYIRPLDTE
jgi:hypothetical protein